MSLAYVILPEMVEPQKYVIYASLTSLAFVLGFLFGPIFGGAIVNNSTWRWVFLLKFVSPTRHVIPHLI
jgi:MFS family permease